MKRLCSLITVLLLSDALAHAAEVSVTMDDPEVSESPLFTPEQRNENISKALDQYKITAALFVCGMRVDNLQGEILLKSCDAKKHLIANHSYSHLYYPSKKLTFMTIKMIF